MTNSLERVTSVQSTHHGRYTNTSTRPDTTKSYRTIVEGQGISDEEIDCSDFKARLQRTRVCHSTSAMGTMFGNIWIRKSTLKVEAGSTASEGTYEIITSLIFYPSQWLTKIGVRHGMEANLSASTSGFRFNVTPIRAVPDNSFIFELCAAGKLDGVQRLFRRGEASVRDTNSNGWTPLHVSGDCATIPSLPFRVNLFLCFMLLNRFF